ncbi:unnamed protein product [Paramecium primaurelia]|uniref:Alpha-type protein kinase domain-containing protein n=1 Tax=Paramecium primaurelia TaxID=5886 RepID=A0A8S1K391_PARPR|nr:unnamed protein product [Paramecium primaurelia]
MQNFNQQGFENQQYANQQKDINQQNYTPEQIQAYYQQSLTPEQLAYLQSIYTPEQLQAYYLQLYQQQLLAQQQQYHQQVQQVQLQNGIQNQINQVPQKIQNNQNHQQQTQQFPQNQVYAYAPNQVYPPNFYIQQQPNNNNERLRQLTSQIRDLETKIQYLENEKDDLENKKTKEIKNYQTQLQYERDKVKQLEEDEKKKDEAILNYKTDQFQTNFKISQLEKQCTKLQDQLREKETEIDKLNSNNQKIQFMTQNTKNTTPDYEKQMQQFCNQQQALLQEEKNKYKLLNNQKNSIEDELKQKDEKIIQLEKQSQDLQIQVEKEHKYFLNAQGEIANWQRKFNFQNKQQEEKDSTIDNLTKQLRDSKFENSQLVNKLKGEEESKIAQQNQFKSIEKTYKNYIEELQKNKSNNQNKSKFEDEISKLKNEMLQNQQKYEEEQKKAELLKEQEYQENKIKKAMQEQQRLENRKQENKKIKEIMMKKTQGSLEECGKLDICYVVDFTLSMQPYVEQARCCVQESLKIIKQQTNRDTNISSIAYYDIEQKPKTGSYFQFDFSNNVQNFQQFMLDIKFEGGRDPPEDVRGALEQMMKNLKWKSKFKIAILITDSPCHGKKYHSFPVDFHSDDDITQTLHRLIEQQIILIGFNLNDKTTKMYEEFKKVYEAKNAQDFFLLVDVAGLKVHQLAEKMASSLGSASVNATQVKQSGTKSKKQQQERPKNKDGAMEALCKQGDFFNFEQQTKVVDTVFTVLNVTINDQVFNNNLQSINNIGKQPNKDYIIKEEGKWSCIRTELPFAFGMMKDVFLMKKKNGGPEELYVIKTPLGSKPYQSQLEAIQECRSHLICQQLMKKFKNDIADALEQQNFQKNEYPNVVYSDFLILEETKNKYWIAERFFKGEFVKYNNNFGYINEEITNLNKFAQAFSYYTFFISKGQYMINDVQGVGNYFTDPAINTTNGDFDDTDLGQEGQQMYLVNFQSKKALAFEILSLLNQLNEDQEQ